MEWAAKLVNNVFGKDLSGGYAILFLLFVAMCIAFVIWAIYYAIVKKSAAELQNITWLSPRDTVKYTGITVITIILVSAVLFVYDFGLDKLVNVIIENANQ